MNGYTISNKQFTLGAKSDFGFFSTANTLLYFNKDNNIFSLKAKTNNIKHLDLTITECSNKALSWKQTSKESGGNIIYTINKLMPGSSYSIYIDNILWKKSKTDAKGQLIFDQIGKTKKIGILLPP